MKNIYKFYLLFLSFSLLCTPAEYRKSDPVRLANEKRIEELNRNLRNIRFLLKHFRIAEAKKILSSTLSEVDSISWNPLSVEAYYTAGLVYFEEKDYFAALNLFFKSLEFAKKEQMKENIARIFNSIALIYCEDKKIDDALILLDDAYKNATYAETKLSIQNAKALCFRLKKENKKAWILLKKIVKTSNKKGLYEIEISALLQLADIASEKDPVMALNLSCKAFDVAEFWDDDRGRLSALEKQIEFAGKAGNNDIKEKAQNALSYLRKKLFKD